MSETNERFHDDPGLTAYALGELTGDEAREVEALLASNADARRVVDEIRATATLVTAELGAAGGATLTPEQRARIAARAGVATPVVPMWRVYWTAAAALIVGATAGAATSTMWMAPRVVEKSMARASDGPASDAARRTSEALLKELQNSNTAVDPSNAKTRADSEKLSEALNDAFLGSGVTGGGGGGGGGSAKFYPPPTPKPAEPAKLEEARGGLRFALGRAEDPNSTKSPDLAKLVGSGGGGANGVGLPPAPPMKVGDKLKVPAPYRGPGGESSPTAPDTRAPSDPPPPPEGGGPGTPGDTLSGPSTGGPDAGVRLASFADLHKLTPAQQKAVEELFRSGASLSPEELTVKLKCLTFQLDGTISADGLADFERTTAAYSHIEDNPFRLVKDAPLSTFGADVDTASYSNVRRFLNSRQLPPPGAVRIEEMINYFPYDYAPPTDGRPFAVRVDVAGCPWKTDHRLVRIGIKGKIVESAARPAANLVFLLDVSGSMSPPERLPLVKQSMKLLVERLEAKDRVAIVVYAGESGLALPSTSCEDKGKILAALDSLHAGGSTNGASGIQLAYQVATQNRIDGGVNRVILATDGDFNVGVSDDSSLVKLIEEERKTGVFLSVLGVGTDNLKDAKMEQLADHGNGAYAYVDTLKEGQKVLVEQAAGTLYTIAKDVKLQVEFNPAQVGSWRLIGYEDRVLAAEDFKDDKKDAGDIGAGHTVTALYELVPTGVLTETAGVEPLKYQRPPAPTGATSNELLTVKLRWKEPNSDISTPMEVAVIDEGLGYSSASPDYKFAASVAAFGMCLRNSPNKGQANLMAVLELATEGAANDPGGYRKEFIDLVKRAVELGAK